MRDVSRNMVTNDELGLRDSIAKVFGLGFNTRIDISLLAAPAGEANNSSTFYF